MVNLFGKGFIGSHYANMYKCIVNDRNDLRPKTNNILYLISTVDNYNIKINPYVDIDTNLTTLIRVLENCKNIPECTFNFASSWFVYGNSNEIADEKSYCDPVGFYSITKRAAEQLLINYCTTYGIKYRIFRFSNVLGPNDNKVSEKKNVLTYLIRKIKNNEDIEVYTNVYRDYIHVTDLCNAIHLLLENAPYDEIYNIGTETSTNLLDCVEYVIQKINSKSKILKITNSNTTRPVKLNCSKLNSFGFKPNYKIHDILDELLDEEN